VWHIAIVKRDARTSVAITPSTARGSSHDVVLGKQRVRLTNGDGILSDGEEPAERSLPQSVWTFCGHAIGTRSVAPGTRLRATRMFDA